MAYTKLETGSAADAFASGEHCLQQHYPCQQQRHPEEYDLFEEHETKLFTGPRRHFEDVNSTFLFSAMDEDLEDQIDAVLTSINHHHTSHPFSHESTCTRNIGDVIETEVDPKLNCSNYVDHTLLKFEIKNNKSSMIKLKQHIKHVRSIRCKLHEEQSMISSKISKIRERKESLKNGSEAQNIECGKESEIIGSNLRTLTQNNILNLSQVVKNTMEASQQVLNDNVIENKEPSTLVTVHGSAIEQLHGYRKAKSFPVRLMNALKDLNGEENTVAWLNDGKSFVIVDPIAFLALISKYVLCKKDCKYESIIRKLHRWGFVRLANGTGIDVFHHPSFHRDYPQWTINITASSSDSNSNTLNRSAMSQDRDSSPSLAGIEKYMSLLHN